MNKNRYDFKKNSPTFLSIGTIYIQKGYERLLRNHKKLLNEGFKHYVVIIGDGQDMKKINNMRLDLGVQDTVTLLGFVDNPYPYLKAADYFLISSFYESFPTVLFEALALKKRIITSEVPGVQEMLNNGKLGAIVENSESALYEGMKKALKEPESFKYYEDNLRNYDIPFTLEKAVKLLMNIMDDL